MIKLIADEGERDRAKISQENGKMINAMGEQKHY